MFIATSNTMSSIQPALRDRMEITKNVRLYDRGKGGNSTSTFASRQLKEHGLTSKDLTFKAIGKIVEGYP
jgi:ATP-dependent Lon protease